MADADDGHAVAALVDDETRQASPPLPAWTNDDGTGQATTTAKTPNSDVAVGLNSPSMPEYTTHDKLQTSHRGQYSIERMLALYDYTQRVSTARALAVCVLTPLPALALAIALQLLPLKKYNPFQWHHDTAFWVLTSVLSFCFALSVTLQARTMLPTYAVSPLKALVLALATGAAMIALLYVVGHEWMFPVPFTFVLGMAPFVVVWLALFLLLVRHKPSPGQVTSVALPLRRFISFLVVQMAVIVAFAAFHILLVELTPKVLAKKLTFLLYQTIRNIFKHTAACYLLRHAQDFVPELVCFSVELFVALYMLFELRSAYDHDPTTAVLGTVFLGALTGWIHLSKRLKKLQALRTQAQLPSCGREALQALVDALKKPEESLDETVLRSMRLRATGGHKLPLELNAIVDHLETLTAFQPAPEPSKGSISSGIKGSAVVAPVEEISSEAATATATTRALHLTLAVLFNTEYVVLIKYVETIVPITFAVFMVVVVDANLANLGAFATLAVLKVPLMAHLHDDILLYCGLMALLAVLLSLALAALLKCKRKGAGVGVLHHLAFVLENQQLQIQAKLVAYVLLAVHLLMFQYGADFHTQFAWKRFFPKAN